MKKTDLTPILLLLAIVFFITNSKIMYYLSPDAVTNKYFSFLDFKEANIIAMIQAIVFSIPAVFLIKKMEMFDNLIVVFIAITIFAAFDAVGIELYNNTTIPNFVSNASHYYACYGFFICIGIGYLQTLKIIEKRKVEDTETNLLRNEIVTLKNLLTEKQNELLTMNQLIKSMELQASNYETEKSNVLETFSNIYKLNKLHVKKNKAKKKAIANQLLEAKEIEKKKLGLNEYLDEFDEFEFAKKFNIEI